MTGRFQQIQMINISDEQSWKDKVFITMDLDWACDDVLNDTIDLVERYDVAVTWFVTHDTPVLERLRENPKFELGLHPNFNFLLQGDDRLGKTTGDVISNIKKIVPEALSVRSHSMTQSSNILDLFVQNGFTHDYNHFIPMQSGIELKPWQLWNDLIKVPYFWEDDISCLYKDLETGALLDRQGIKVFDFHPIHVFLNSEVLTCYEETRHIHHDAEALLNYRNKETYGARNALIELLENNLCE